MHRQKVIPVSPGLSSLAAVTWLNNVLRALPVAPFFEWYFAPKDNYCRLKYFSICHAHPQKNSHWLRPQFHWGALQIVLLIEPPVSLPSLNDWSKPITYAPFHSHWSINVPKIQFLPTKLRRNQLLDVMRINNSSVLWKDPRKTQPLFVLWMSLFWSELIALGCFRFFSKLKMKRTLGYTAPKSTKEWLNPPNKRTSGTLGARHTN